MEIGMEIGMEKGIVKGREETKKETAINAYHAGLEMETISKISGLDQYIVEEIITTLPESD